MVAYVYLIIDADTKDWQKKLYDAVIAEMGLKGNRATPLATANFHECRESKMPAVLMGCGFMDSVTDVPIILTENFADQVASACVRVIVSKAKPSKKEVAPSVSVNVNGINVGRGEDDMILYVGKASTGINKWGVEAILNANLTVDSVGKYGVGNTTIPAGKMVLSVHNKASAWMLENLKVGQKVKMTIG